MAALKRACEAPKVQIHVLVEAPDFSKDTFSGITRTSEAKSFKKSYNEAELEIDMHAKRIEQIRKMKTMEPHLDNDIVVEVAALASKNQPDFTSGSHMMAYLACAQANPCF